MELSDKELVHLARLAIEGKVDDVALMIRRLAKKIGSTSPETAQALLRLAKRGGASQPTRGAPVAGLPVDLETRLELAKVEREIQLQSAPLWESGVEQALAQAVAERENQDALAKADLRPTRSLLFVGPPGVGKTLSARWVAAQLHVPLITLDLSAVMSSFLGRTGSNLRNILDYAKGTRCVLLLDEFDAIAKRRDDAVEIGELKRLVTVLLQEIDHWPASGILVAATNHPELLDPAVWRRFDAVIRFDLPSDEQVRQFVFRILGQDRAAEALAIVMKGSSFSDIERDIRRAQRQAVLAKTELAQVLDSLVKAKAEEMKQSDRIALAMKLLEIGYSHRRTKEITTVSRDTMRKKEALAGQPEDDDATEQ